MASKFLTSEETQGVNEIRSEFRNDLPRQLDTELYLARWWRVYKGDMNEIRKYFPIYLANRKIINCDREDFITNAFDKEIYKNIIFPIATPISKMDDVIDQSRNCVVFVEWSMAHAKQWSKHSRSYDYLFGCFVYCEYIQQLILRQEERTGRASTSIVIMDMRNMVLSDWINVFSAHFKIMHLRTKMWELYFPELVHKVIIVNQPRLMTLVWKLANVLLSESHRKGLYFMRDYAEICDHLDSNVIPACYGGNLKDLSGFGDPETCCRPELSLTEELIYRPGTVWKELDIKKKIPERKLAIIKPHKNFILEYAVNKPGAKLVWQFSANGAIEFGVSRISDDDYKSKSLVWPQLSLIAGKVPEERILTCEQVGTYLLEFRNNDGVFNLKLEYIVCLIDEK